MPADLVPHAAIPELAGRVRADMLEVLGYLQKQGYISNSSELPPEVVKALEQLAVMGLVDPGYEVREDIAEGRPYLWTRNGNGTRVLRYLTGIRSGPRYEIASPALASWLEDQGLDRYWAVGGDPLLTGRINFPCKAAQLAKELRKIDRLLIVQAKEDDTQAEGQLVGKEKLDQLVRIARRGHRIGQGQLPVWQDRAFSLCWSDSIFEWTLTEDSRTMLLMREAEEVYAREKARVKKV